MTVAGWPPLFIEQVAHWPGCDPELFQRSHEESPPVSVRLNPGKMLHSGAVFPGTQPVPWCPEGRYLRARPDFTLDPLFHAGAYYVQEASSMSLWTALEELVPEKHGLRVLDLCGAPGGKSTLIASWLNGEGLLVANETIRSRAGILADNLTRWGLPNTMVSNNDPRTFSQLSGFFDIVVVDAPCSGSGLFRKDPAAMRQWSPEAVLHCAARQERIVADVWPALKEGGLLLYSTCSYSSEENEATVRFIVSELGAEVIPVKTMEKNNWGIVATGEGYRFYPHRLKGEGFFLAALRKTALSGNLRIKEKIKSGSLHPVLRNWLRQEHELMLQDTHLGENLFPAGEAEAGSLLLQRLHILKYGVLTGKVAGNAFIPDHELALSTLLNDSVPRLELSGEEALRFLKKESLPGRNDLAGRLLITFDGLGLGWGNALPNRINNGLPKGWRILKEL